MRILYLNVVVDYSSTGRLVRDLAEGSKNQGHQVKILYGRKSSNKDEDTVFVGNKVETAFHGLMTKMFGRHGLHSTQSTQRIINEIKEFNPDIIHLHNLHGYWVNVPMLLGFLKEYNKPIVWTLHDFWMISGSAANFHYYGCKEWHEGCVINNHPSLYPGSYFIKRQRKNFKWKKDILSSMNNIHYITVSKWQKEEFNKSFLNNKPIDHIYNGIDLNVFQYKNKKIKSSLNLLAVANDWKESKGLNDLLNLSKSLKSNEHLTIIGLTQKQINQLKDYDHITLIERTSNIEELVSHYQEADVYLNLSYEETMGMTTVEALACGTPCVTYDKTALPELINDRVGAVVTAGAYDEALRMARNMNKNGLDCREYVEGLFDKNKMIMDYMSIYESTE